MGCYLSLGMETERQRWARIGIERAQSAMERNPENASPAHRGALALAHMGEAERAKEWVSRALAIDPDDIVAQYNAASSIRSSVRANVRWNCWKPWCRRAPATMSSGSIRTPTWTSFATIRASARSSTHSQSARAGGAE